MNVYLSLSDEELDALEDFWADQIGKADERVCDMAMKRIEQLRHVRERPMEFVTQVARGGRMVGHEETGRFDPPVRLCNEVEQRTPAR